MPQSIWILFLSDLPFFHFQIKLWQASLGQGSKQRDPRFSGEICEGYVERKGEEKPPQNKTFQFIAICTREHWWHAVKLITTAQK